MEKYGIRWQEFNRYDRLVTKEKLFDTEKKMNGFEKKLRNKDNFYAILAYLAR